MALPLFLTYFNDYKTSMSNILELTELNQTPTNINDDHDDHDNHHSGKANTPSLQTPVAALQTGSLSHHNNEFVTITFHQNYKKKKKKNKNPMTALKGKTEIRIQQRDYREVGAAWKVWDSAIILSRWIHLNNDLLFGKIVLEVGSGCGLVGILSSFYAKEITISDYLPDILEGIEKNVSLNYTSLGKSHEHIQIRKIDFQDFVETNKQIGSEDEKKELEEKFDVVLGSDVVYSLQLAQWLPFLLNSVLKCNGFFYAIMPKNRLGLDEFIENMTSLGFKIQITNPPEKLFEDFAKKSHWFLYIFQKVSPSQTTHSKVDNHELSPSLTQIQKDENEWDDYTSFFLFKGDPTSDDDS